MKNEQDYIQDITEIRSMMERSSRFLSLSGWAGIMAGLYALAGVYLAGQVFHFNPAEVPFSGTDGTLSGDLLQVIVLALVIFLLAMSNAIFLSYKKASISGEKIWSATTRRLLSGMAVPLIAGGLLILVFISKGLPGMMTPLSLLFYGLALYNASKFTLREVKILGFIEMTLGLINACYVEYSLILWALGFGAAHIVYGIYMYFKYER